MVAPLSIDRASLGLSPVEEMDVVEMVLDLEDQRGRQAPCADCKEWVDPSAGCYAPAGLPEGWKKIEPWASQACATEGCACWGGQDRECEDCWLSLK